MWKKNEEGNLILDDNKNPIWIDDNTGIEKAMDDNGVKSLKKQVAELTEKAHNRKDVIESFSSVLEKAGLTVENLPDFIAEAQSNKEKIANLGTGKGGDKILEATKPLQEQIDALKKSYEESKKENEKLKALNEEEKINSLFVNSQFLKEKSDYILVRDIFRKNFTYENGQLVAYLNGEKIKNDMGENITDFETCIKLMIEKYPSKDKLLVGNLQGGVGGTGSNDSIKDYSHMSFGELCLALDKTTNPVEKETIKQLMDKMK